MNPFTILVVDDNEEFRTFLVTILQDEGFAVTPAGSVKEAMTLVEREKPGMMILDLMMPETTGDELCRIIKDDPYLRDVIIIILSATSDIEVKLTCFASGANEYLVKPVDSRELIARVKRFIRMMDEFRDTPHSGARTKIEKFSMEKSYGSIELMDSSTGDSVARIKPKYGIYRVDNLIGSGGMGHVFKAYDEPLDRYVAIKILSKKLSRSPEFVERFKREAKVLAAINHPGIAYIFSFGQEDEDLYFSMQWCPGGSVSDLIRAKGRVDLLPAIEIMLQSAQALAAATRKGVVHRDVKPSNLLFDENQQIKIVDFGLASAEKMSAQITQVQEFLGTPSFMAPEQAQSASVDYRADIYSLGITFYYLLYGKLPFQANSAIEMVVKHASEPFPPFDSSNGRIPREAYDIILRMTQKLPDQRYREYSELISDLEKVRSLLLSQSQLKIPRAEKISGPPALTGKNFFELLARVNQQNLPGVLTAKWGGLQKTFLVRQRHVVLFESSQTDEDIWAFLVHKNIIASQDTPAKNAGLEATLAKYLLDQKISMEQFKISYRELMKSALLQIFLWPVFEGEFSHAGIEHDAFVKVPLADALLEASRTLIDLSTLKEDLSPSDVISKTSEFEQVLSTLALKPEESFLASRIEGQDITLSTLQMLTGLPEAGVNRFIYALTKMGALQFSKPKERRPVKPSEPNRPPQEVRSPRQEFVPPVQPAPPPQPASSAPPSRPPASRPAPEVIRPIQEIPSRPQQTDTSTRPAPSPPQTQTALKTPVSDVRSLAPEIRTPGPESRTPPPESRTPVPSGRSQSVTALHHAASKAEASYLEEMISKRLVAQPAEKKDEEMSAEPMVRMEVQKSEKKIELEHHIRVAEQFFRLAEEKFQEEDYWKVAQLCKQAIKNHPVESKYYHLMATAYAKHPRFGKDAEQCFYKALEMDPWNPDYHVDLARFYLAQGLSKRAKTHAEKALQITPGHQKARDLLQEIKVAR